jgi:hypothetical protein
LATQTSYRWNREYGGLRSDQAKRLKDLKNENARLKQLLADAGLDKAILREAAEGRPWAAQLNFSARRSVDWRSIMLAMSLAVPEWANAGHAECLVRRETRIAGSRMLLTTSHDLSLV